MNTIRKTKKIPSGYGMIQTDIMTLKGVSIQAKALYALLASYTGSGDYCFPSIKTISENLEISEKLVYKYMKELKENNLVIVSKLYKDLRNHHQYELCYIEPTQNVNVDEIDRFEPTRNRQVAPTQNVNVAPTQNRHININNSINNNINNINICDDSCESSCDSNEPPLLLENEAPENIIFEDPLETQETNIGKPTPSNQQESKVANNDSGTITKKIKKKVKPKSERTYYTQNMYTWQRIVDCYAKTYLNVVGCSFVFSKETNGKELSNLKKLVLLFEEWVQKNEPTDIDNLFFWNWLEYIMRKFLKYGMNAKDNIKPTPSLLHCNINQYLPPSKPRKEPFKWSPEDNDNEEDEDDEELTEEEYTNA